MPIQKGRHTARIEGDFVVFLIGPRAGLLRAGESVSVTGRNDSARQRLARDLGEK